MHYTADTYLYIHALLIVFSKPIIISALAHPLPINPSITLFKAFIKMALLLSLREAPAYS
jgi:hypothetical protein